MREFLGFSIRRVPIETWAIEIKKVRSARKRAERSRTEAGVKAKKSRLTSARKLLKKTFRFFNFSIEGLDGEVGIIIRRVLKKRPPAKIIKGRHFKGDDPEAANQRERVVKFYTQDRQREAGNAG